MKNLAWIIQNLCWNLMKTLNVSYENVKFKASDVIRKTLCQRLSLVEFLKLKNNWLPECRFPKYDRENFIYLFI